ncbi:Adenosylcobinamide-phosphate synthase [Dehalobacter sp. UNSWDHB]|jgi:cobalamin biosynthesis protein CobD|uniref:adenosylcobinamide-phosphate synthase CbiB n=1 Tax=unclassified Dehalobacter TaxID=2635733 RepID=UPI00028B8DB6|nr:MULTISPECIES: adenosylcobinamide-phosphate synthase CbiB [unclassified Dehalobacter]AFV01774.1 Adenosylcobinamide-phosphate synthase [Dehalobacter sp. DCA]AFV04810.1 Adenosylcobinamide-phosphate synthase [Dehalobacter sp. CF]EQB19850.1 Adenosylcobinamide-phosphate synthase [Dehalobacter sp. UNSWDHB]
MITLYALITGYILDLIFGDPSWLPHPVRWIGSLIAAGDKYLHRISCKTNRSQYWCGVLLTAFIVTITFLVPLGLLYLLKSISPLLGFIAEALMCYQILATKSLKAESMKVYDALQKNDIMEARYQLSWIVGRDTENLNSSQVAKGAVETVAENLSDGIIAPMIFILVGGAPLGFLYKAVNTLDSMIGYKNDKYLYFGRFAAKLDDVVNYLPARISAYLMLLAVFLTRYDFKNAFRIYRRDRHNHTSPNSAHTEAVCAGALNIQLAGSNHYFGKLVVKPTIGDPIREIEAEDIRRANKLMIATSLVGLILGSAVRAVIVQFGC